MEAYGAILQNQPTLRWRGVVFEGEQAQPEDGVVHLRRLQLADPQDA